MDTTHAARCGVAGQPFAHPETRVLDRTQKKSRVAAAPTSKRPVSDRSKCRSTLLIAAALLCLTLIAGAVVVALARLRLAMALLVLLLLARGLLVAALIVLSLLLVALRLAALLSGIPVVVCHLGR